MARPWSRGQEAAEMVGALTLSFQLWKHSIYVHQTAIKNCLGVSHLPTALLSSIPLVPYLPTLGCLPEWQAGRLYWVVSTHTSQKITTSSRYHSVRGHPLTLTQVEGNETFWRLSTLSDNSAFSLKASTRKLQTFKTNLVFIQLCNHFYVLSVFHTPWNGTTLCNWISCTVTQRH